MATAAYRKSEDSSRLSGLLKAGLSARNIRNSQKRRPTASRYCQNRPKHQKQPEEEANCQQVLPEPPEVQVLGTLVPEPEPELPQFVVNAEGLACQAADDDHHQRPEECVDAGPLVSGLLATDPRRQEKAAAHPGRRDPEDGGLEVPGTCQGLGQPAGDF